MTDVSIHYLNRHEESKWGENEQEEEEGLRVVQHMSAACRASYEDSVRELPSAWLLRQVIYICIYIHIYIHIFIFIYTYVYLYRYIYIYISILIYS
jgi:hypothetical protein